MSAHITLSHQISLMLRKTAKPRADLVWQADTQLGETPVWCPQERLLAFIDGPNGVILRYWPESGRTSRTPVASELGFIVVGAGNELAYGTGLAIHAWAPDGPVQIPGDPSVLRLNDAKRAPDGHLWTGTMHRAGSQPLGSIYRISPAGTVECIDTGFTIPNGFAVDAASRCIFIADSPTSTVFRYDLRNSPTTPRIAWLKIDPAIGFPDGMAVDAEGFLWVALYGGGRVQRYAPDATLHSEIMLPTRNVTACAFGGPEGRDLYISTAKDSVRGLFRTVSRGGGLYRAANVAPPA
jgi:sugar lactone lactonase YvrE